jgi:FtsH-binding integral membrane protein
MSQPQVSTQTLELALSTHKVLRNTYWLLALTLVPTAVGAIIGMNLNFAFMAASPLLSALAMLAVMFGLFWAISVNRNSAWGIGLLFALTFFMGVILGPLLQLAFSFRNGGALVALSAGGTAAVFFALASVATVTRRDFGFLGNFLFVGLVLLILAMLANLYFQIPALALTLSSIAVLLFSLFILFDVSRIVNGGETNYVMAALALYLDIYNLFANLLQLALAFAGERD